MTEFINPEKILDQLDLKENITVCEFGCGSGMFSISLAKRLKQGKVYGLDILEEKLEALKTRVSLENLLNIEIVLSNIEEIGGSTLSDNSIDLVLIPNVLFQNENKKIIIEEAKRITKKGGEILIVDWKKEIPSGPKEGTISIKEVKEIAEILNLKFKKEIEAGIYHYCLVFTKI